MERGNSTRKWFKGDRCSPIQFNWEWSIKSLIIETTPNKCGLRIVKAVNICTTYLCFASNISSEPCEGNNFLLLHNVLQKPDSTSQVHVLDGIGGLTGILEVDPQVRSLCLSSWKIITQLYSQEFHTKKNSETVTAMLFSHWFEITATWANVTGH